MIRVSVAHMRVAARTHPGMSGKKNEDAFGISAYRLGPANATPAVLAVVSDGIGGHRAGEVASRLVVETVSQVVASSDGNDPLGTLLQAAAMANYQVLVHAGRDNSKTGMGATLVCALVIGDRLYAASVGDSRLYWMRGARIQQLSIDHTWVHDAIEHGLIRPEEARTHPNAHVIRRYIGSQPPPEIDFRLNLPEGDSRDLINNQGLQLLPGDVLLLCTDGLTDLVDDDEILAIVRQHASLERAADVLIELANQRGGHDNITVVLLQMLGESPTVPVPPGLLLVQAQTMHKSQRWVWFALGLLILLLLLVLGVAFLWVLGAPLLPPTPTPTPLL